MKRARATAIGVVIAAVLGGGGLWFAGPAVAEPAVGAAEHAGPRFERIYRYAGGETGKKVIEDAVEETVREMNLLIRPIARRRMLEANAVIPELGFHLSGDTLAASYVGGRVIEAPADGTAVPWTDPYGEKIRVSHRLTGGALHQTMIGKRGNRRNRYAFSADGKTMTMSVEINSDSLPAPLHYAVSYRRAE